MKQQILHLRLASHKIYGAPKMTMELQKAGIKISWKTLGNDMREMGMKAHYVKPYVKTTIDPDFDTRLKNLLNENFNPDGANALWYSDITYVHTEKGVAYLTSIMDFFSRRIIARRLSTTPEAKWVIRCVLEAKEKRRALLEIHAQG